MKAIRTKHLKTLDAIFERPTRSSIRWSDIEALFAALGADITERAGSAILIELFGLTIGFHRPHPGREARKYQVEAAREFLTQLSIR